MTHEPRCACLAEPARATAFGFEWGQIVVERISAVRRRAADRGAWRVVRVNDVQVYVSPTARSIRVFRRGKELKP